MVRPLYPCTRCSRHVRHDDPHCPFCGERRGPAPARALLPVALAGVGLALAGCDDIRGPAAVYGGPPVPPVPTVDASPGGAASEELGPPAPPPTAKPKEPASAPSPIGPPAPGSSADGGPRR